MTYRPRNRLGSVARRTSSDGYSFDSKLEAALYAMLRLREIAGEIRELKVKPNVYLTDARVLMIPDFCAIEFRLGLYDGGQLTFYEAKGFETEIWRLKRRLWKHYGPGPLVVFRGSAKCVKEWETIRPTGDNT